MRDAIRSRRFLVPLLTTAFLLLLAAWASAQLANGKLQIHHIDVGQGDGALIVSPLGQLAVIDDGLYTNCSAFVNYITGLGITNFDYNFVSHYHADHIGCLDDLLGAGVVLNIAGYDRAYSYSTSTYTDYVTALGSKRQAISKNQIITLDAGSANPVTIKCVDLNGAGVYPVDGSDENSKSVVLKISYGNFDEVMGGDLTGDSDNDVESTVGPEVGDVEVYKVHHHASATSSTDNWLNSTTPEVGVISVGDNSYGHPTADALTRLHDHGVKTYWTEIGDGVTPVEGWDKVGGTIIIQASPDPGASYTVAGSGFVDTYYNSSGELYEKTYYPTSVAMLIGTLGSGGYTNLGADDGSYMRVDGVKVSRRYYTDWYASTVISEEPAEFTITYNGNYTQSGTQTLYLYNFSAGSWTQVDEADIGTTDATRIYRASSPANFVSPSGEIRVRVARDSSPRAYSCNADYLAYTVKYAAPAPLAFSSDEDKTVPATVASLGDPDMPDMVPPYAAQSLQAWPNPFNPFVRISFEVERDINGRLSVYDVSGRLVAVLANGMLERGLHVLVWNGADSSGKALSSGIYIAMLDGDGTSQSVKLVMLR